MKRLLIGSSLLTLFALFVPTASVASALAKPLVLALLHGFGVDAVDLGEAFQVAGLNVPWTRDCAGADLLVLLPAIVLWVTRDEPLNRRWLLRIACTLPAAIVANVLRILTLIGWRWAIAPTVESPQVHYFLGLIWLVPFVAAVMPHSRRACSRCWVEATQAAVVIALLPGLQGVPYGWVGMVSAVFLLSQTDGERSRPRLILLSLTLWALAGVVVAMLRMESFWLPWALMFPPTVCRKTVFSVSGIVLLASTHAVLLLLPGVAWVAMGVLLLRLGSVMSGSASSPEPRHRWATVPLAMASLLLPMPFLVTLWPQGEASASKPPAGVLCRPMNGNGFAVSLQGSPESLGMVWFGSESGDRHHSVTVCMKYRGVSLAKVDGCPGVFANGTHWYREFFLHEDQLLLSYGSYLKHCFRPGSAPGVHLIAVMSKDRFSAEEFNQAACDLARGIHQQAAGDTASGKWVTEAS